MGAQMDDQALVGRFIAKWQNSGGAELANFQMFITELCTLLAVPHPIPTVEDERQNLYVFEKAVFFKNGDGTVSNGRIDLYKEGCFVLEAKQGSAMRNPSPPLTLESFKRRHGTAVRGTQAWIQAMEAARNQAERYAKAIAEWPPFLVVVDVGYAFALYADFARKGKAYVPFPDPATHRIAIEDLVELGVRERLRLIWTDPMSLDPSRHAAMVTRAVAEQLAELAKSLEAAGNQPEAVAEFIIRCIFTMFAEDVGLLPRDGFSRLLEDMRASPTALASMMRSLWDDMDRGGFSPALRETVLRFNGRFFHKAEALPLTSDQIALVIRAAKTNWSQVEPAIFGTLLERALDPGERHKLGAHFTPRSYVDRLILPTLVEPLRKEWEAVKAAALSEATRPEKTRDKAARRHRDAVAMVDSFRSQLCSLMILDPACGTGNFLYVALEHLKRIEGEVVETLADLGAGQEAMSELRGSTVDPHQFLGIEKNPRAAAIAEIVIWIGYLQWHFRTYKSVLPAQPVLRDFRNIECRDSVLAYQRSELALDEAGRPVTHWDGTTMKTSPITGEDIPDESARVPTYRLIQPRRATWPRADFIVGTPPLYREPQLAPRPWRWLC